MEDVTVARLLEENARLRQENELLRQKLDLVLRKLFGSSSEKFDPTQLELLLDPDASKKPVVAGNASAAEVPSVRTSKGVPRKPRLPEHLPVEEIILDPEPVKACPEAWRCIGEEVSEQLDYQPGKFSRRRLVRRKYIRLADKAAAPIIAPLPARLQDGCLATPGLIAEILVNKHAWHQPLHRQEAMFRQRHGVTIPRQTMMNWETLAADRLTPLYQLIRKSLLGTNYLQIDETPVRYLEPGNGKAKTGYYWVYRSAGGTVLYDWRPGRSHSYLHEILRDGPNAFQGILQSDGYAAYDTYRRSAAAQGQVIALAACWAHARRKFHDAHGQSPSLVGWILRQIGHLYFVESRLRQVRAGPALRAAIRSAESIPIYQRLGKVFRMLERRRGILPKSALGIALRYTLGLWTRLGVYLSHGHIEIDNNGVENAIRPTAVGKKNWLFIGREDSGWKSAVFYTLIANCRLHGIDPHAWFRGVLERLPATTNHNLGELLPMNWNRQGPPKWAAAS